MISIYDSLNLPENSEIITYCQGESEFLKYFVFYLSNDVILISTYTKQTDETAYEFVPWSKNYKILCFKLSNLHSYLHILTTNNYYIIIPFEILHNKAKRKKWEEFISSESFNPSYIASLKQTGSSIKMLKLFSFN